MWTLLTVAWADPTRADALAALTDVQAGLAAFDYPRVEARLLPDDGAAWPARRFDLVRYALEGRLSAGAVAALADGEWGPARGRLSDTSLSQLVPGAVDPARVWLLTRGAAAVLFVDDTPLRVARLEHVEVLAPPTPARGALPDGVPAAPADRAAAVALLVHLRGLLGPSPDPAALALVHSPVGTSPEAALGALGRLRTLGELDEQGIRLLEVHGVWGPVGEVLGAEAAARHAEALGVAPTALWALALGEARAIFVVDTSGTRLAQIDEVGRLGRALGLLPLGTPGVYEAVARVEAARGRPWTGPLPRWGTATDVLGAGGARDLSLRHGVPVADLLVLGTQPPLAFRWDGHTLTLLDTWKAGMGG